MNEVQQGSRIPDRVSRFEYLHVIKNTHGKKAGIWRDLVLTQGHVGGHGYDVCYRIVGTDKALSVDRFAKLRQLDPADFVARGETPEASRAGELSPYVRAKRERRYSRPADLSVDWRGIFSD